MGAKLTLSNGALRKAVREVMAMAAGYPFTDAMLCRLVGELFPGHEIAESDLLEAATWNLSKGYVAAEDNEDTELREWTITNHGIAKEKIK